MTKKRLQLRNVSNVAASGTVLIEIPVGPRYHTIILQHGFANGTNTIAGALANITEIRIKRNGRIQRIFSGVQLLDFNLRNGAAYNCLGVPNTAPGVAIPIHFAEPWRMDEIDQDALAWATAGWDSFQIEVQLGAAATPTVVAFAVTDNLVPKTEPGIVKVLRQSFAAAGTQFDISTLDRRDWLQSITIYPDSGGSNSPSRVTLRQNGDILHELTNGANAALLTQFGMTTAAATRTAGVYDLVLDHDNLLGSAVPLDASRDLTLTIESAGAMSGNTTIMIERLGTPE